MQICTGSAKRHRLLQRIRLKNHCEPNIPDVARSFFEGKGMDVKVLKIEGSVELAPLLGLSDAIIDILVETGSTLKENGLEVIEKVCDISARLIVNTASMKLRKQEIDTLINQMEQAKEAKKS